MHGPYLGETGIDTVGRHFHKGEQQATFGPESLDERGGGRAALRWRRPPASHAQGRDARSCAARPSERRRRKSCGGEEPRLDS
jgi:hypothetical protein